MLYDGFSTYIFIQKSSHFFLRIEKWKSSKRIQISSQTSFPVILTCSFEWNHLMVLCAYHYHPSGELGGTTSKWPGPDPFWTEGYNGQDQGTGWMDTDRSGWNRDRTGPTELFAAVDSIKFVCLFADIFIWRMFGSLSALKMFAPRHCFNAKLAHTHTLWISGPNVSLFRA